MLNSQNNQVKVMARWINNQIILQQSGMKIFNNFNRGQIHIICIQDFTGRKYQILGKQKRTSYRQNYQNCITVRSNPIFDSRTKKYIFIIQLQANDQLARQNLHTLVTIISNVIIVPLSIQDNPSYLSTITKHIDTVQASKIKNNIHISKISNLLCILISQNHTQKGQFIRDQTQKLLIKFQSLGILNQIITSYPNVKGLQCPQYCLNNSTQNFQQNLLQQIQIMSINPKQNQQLMYGPIFIKYIQNLIKQINKQSQINLQRAQDDIVIDQGYQAYKAGVQRYHQIGLRLIDKNDKPDNNQINKMMNSAKIKAFDTFYAYNGSDNTQYRRMLEDYIDNKNRQVIYTYSEQQRNRNLQILQVQSKNVLTQISTSKVKNPGQINNYISQMTQNYQLNARGPQKYQILNDYMKVFTPIAFEGDPEKQARLRQQMRKNQQLQKTLIELKNKKKAGCCSKCSIM